MKGKIFPSIVTHLSFRRMASLLLVGAAAIAFQGVAYAHNLTVTSATPGCNGLANCHQLHDNVVGCRQRLRRPPHSWPRSGSPRW